jgi:hypothetical protein
LAKELGTFNANRNPLVANSSGKLSELPNGNISPFSNIANYTLNISSRVLEPTPATGTTGMTTLYNLSNIQSNLFHASSDKRSEDYTLTHV